ncbi:MbtH family protein [Streptomyces sp. NPDC059352]|uniref:MbtH family protein n=1 Tax=Streptomyces sp. NPDC059352 TaxID=3346810 RepID=UPI003677A8D1
MINPFENDSGQFLVLANGENQHSLWPLEFDIPDGWSTAFGPDLRAACLEYVEHAWTDMRPASLRAAMDTAPH